MITDFQTYIDIEDYLRNNKNWVKNIVDKDLWSYCKINEIYTIGRQRHDWVLLKKNKNLGFYYVDGYKQIPNDLVQELYKRLNE